MSHRETRIGNHAWIVTGYWTHGNTRFANLARVDRAGDARTVTVARLRGEG
jgi:hypothetical protein